MELRKNREHYKSFEISGFTYYDGAEVLENLKIGDKLTLDPEPNNPHDLDAVGIWQGRYKLGYVPRKHNSTLAKILKTKNADILEIMVQRVDKTEYTERQVTVGVFFVERD